MMKEEASNDNKPSPKKDHKSSSPNPNPNSKPYTGSNPSSTRTGNLSGSDSSNRPKSHKEKSKDSSNTKVGKNSKLTTEEREHRLKEGLCLYCREKGHVVQDCLKSKAAKACTTTTAPSESKSDSTDSKK